jgi:hypothetical protein
MQFSVPQMQFSVLRMQFSVPQMQFSVLQMQFSVPKMQFSVPHMQFMCRRCSSVCCRCFSFQNTHVCVISGFHHEVAENCGLLGYYTASSGNFLLTFRDKLSFPPLGLKNFGFLNAADGTDRLSQNVGKKLPLLAV